MNNRLMINYTPGNTFFHRLNGTTKVFMFIVTQAFNIMTLDVRLMICLFALSLVCIISLKPNWKPILFVVFFMTITVGIIGSFIFILVKPSVGMTHVGGETFIIRWNDRFYLTRELAWYMGVYFFKRISSLFAALLFILSITPSELAAGLNALGLPYKACFIISLAFRTVPDIARDFMDIKNALALRGVELDSRRAGLAGRLRHTVLILVPLIMTSFNRVDTIANALDLRGFGKHKKRGWYCANPPERGDWIIRILTAALAVFCVYYTIRFRIIDPPAFDYWSPWIPY